MATFSRKRNHNINTKRTIRDLISQKNRNYD